MIAWLLKNLRRQHIILSLLLTVTLCLAFGLSDLVRGTTWTLLVPITVIATLLGWALGVSRVNGKLAFSSMAIVGSLGVFAYLAGLLVPFTAFILRIPFMLQQLRGWIVYTRLPDFSFLNEIGSDAATRWTALADRLTTWLSAFAANRNVTDPVVAALIWCVLLWLIAAWAGLCLSRTRQTLSAVAPALVLLTMVFDYSGVKVQTLALQLGAVLVLMGLARYDAQRKHWETARVDFSESIAIETTVMVIAIATALAVIAALSPSLSVRAMMDAWDRITKGDDRLARSLGLQQAPAIPVGSKAPALVMPGLPRSHLIGMPPELLQEVIMTVRTGELPPLALDALPAPPARYYWRTLVYDVYIGTGWVSGETQTVSYEPDASIIKLTESANSSSYHLVKQNVDLLGITGGRLYWTGMPISANLPTTAAWRTQPNEAAPEGDLLGLLADKSNFQVVSLVPRFSLTALRTARDPYPAEIEQRYLRLPKSVPERVVALARKITATGASPYDRARAIERYLRQFPYSLEVPKPPVGRDVADYFLFDLQKGYCDYYATSMVVLARAAGVPARLVIGYAPGEYDAPNARYIVRQAHAHSWVEVYFTGIGWIEFEPTPAYAELLRDGTTPELDDATPPIPQIQGEAWIKALGNLISSIAGQIALGALIVLFGFVAWLIGENWYIASLAPERAAAWLYRSLEKQGSFARQSNAKQTPFEFAETLSAALPKRRFFAKSGESIQHIAALYVVSVFSPRLPTRRDVQRTLRLWIGLRIKLWLARVLKKRKGN